MKQKKKQKRKSLVRILVCMMLAVFFVLPFSGNSEALALEFDPDQNNDLTIKIEYKKASANADYKYRTGSWYISLDEKFDGEKYDLSSLNYDSSVALAIEGEEYKRKENDDGTYTVWQKLEGNKIVSWLETQSEDRKDWLHEQADKEDGTFKFLANKLTYAIIVDEDEEIGPFYDRAEFLSCLEPYREKWSATTQRNADTLYGETVYLTLNYSPFSIEAEDTVTKQEPVTYTRDEDFLDQFPYDEVYHGETIPAITYPGELEEYEYEGYEWRNKNGTKLSGGKGTSTSEYVVPGKDLNGELTLVFLYKPTDDVTPIPTQPPVTIPPSGDPKEVTVYFYPGDGNYVVPVSKKVTYGGIYGELPTPVHKNPDEYEFYGWYYFNRTYTETPGNPEMEEDTPVTRFMNVLVSEDHTLEAVWIKKQGPTETPVPTPKPENKIWYRQRYHFYTTDQGYTMDAIAGDSMNYLAGPYDSFNRLDADYQNGGKITAATQTIRSSSYSVGTDTSGNSWYFIISGTNATYVHPKSYTVNGTVYDVSTNVADITELVFPSTLTCNGTTYTVTSIGGGGATYHTITTTEQKGTYDKWFYQPEYGYYDYVDASTDSYYISHEIGYVYGVLGNGHIISYANTDYDGSSNSEYEYGASDYYVYNTTLKKVTIPQGVEVLQGAFIYCQTLEKVEIAGATVIHGNAFRAATILDAELSSSTEYYDKEGFHVYDDIEYEYNEDLSYTEQTEIMLDWEEVSPLVPKAVFSEFSSVATIRTEAFAYRTNMYELTFGDKLDTVEKDAFYKCKLDMLTFYSVPTSVDNESYNTFGTKGANDRTVISCSGGAAQLIKYGMKWHGYYDVQCGYVVLYHPNGGVLSSTGEPEEYVAVTTAKSVLPQITKLEALQMNAKENVPVAYDINGHIWYYMDGLIQRMDCLKEYNIVNIEGDKQSAGFYYIETSAGDVCYAKLNISYKTVELVDIEKIFNIKIYRDAGTAYGYNCLEPSSGGANYAAYYATGSSTSSKKYYQYTVSYTAEDGIKVTGANSAFVTLVEENSSISSGSTVSNNYWNPIVTWSISGTEVTFSAVNPEAESVSATYSGIGSGYTDVELIAEFKGSSSSQTTPPQGTPSSTGSYKVSKMYALKNASGIQSVVFVSCSWDFNSTSGYSVSFSVESELNLTSPVNKLMFYSRTESNAGALKEYNYLGLGTNGTWYEVTVTETNTVFSSTYGGGSGYVIALTQGTAALPYGLLGIAEMDCREDRAVVLGTDGSVWIGTEFSTITKQSLPEAMTEMRIFGDLYIFTGECGAIYAYGPMEGIGEQFGLAADLTTVTALSHLKDGIEVWDYVDYGIYINGTVIMDLSTGAELYYFETANFDYLYKDILIVDGILYRLSTRNYLVELGSTYKIFAEMIVTNNKIYRLEDGRKMMDEGEDFTYNTPFDGIIFNNGRLYFKDTFEEVPGVTDGFEFIHVIEDYSIFYCLGYKNVRWNTAQDGTGTDYSAGESVKLNSHLELWAQWDEEYKYVRFHKNATAATGYMADLKIPVTEHSAVIPECGYEQPGYEFAGWGIVPGLSNEHGEYDETIDGPLDDLYQEGDVIGTGYGITNLYAKWKENAINYSIIYWKYPYGTVENTIWKSKTLSFNAPETIEGAPFIPSGPFTVTYNLNTTSNMNTAGTAAFVPASLTEKYTRSEAPVFRNAWKWKTVTEDGNVYTKKTFETGDKVSGLTETDGAVINLYPGFEGENAGVILPSATCTGYDFLGWSESADGSGPILQGTSPESDEISIFTPAKNTTLFAIWEPDIAIDYDPNYSPLDADCPTMETTWFDPLEIGVFLTKNAFTKTGYHFVCWNTEPDGSGTRYKDGQYIEGIAERITLYAQWEPNEYYVQYAPDEMGEAPVIPIPGATDIWIYDEEYIISEQPYEKHDKVSYDLNRGDKSTVPELEVLTDANTKSVYRFVGWRLYEKTADGYTKYGLYTAGQKVSNITTEEGKSYVLFPEWESTPDGVMLPDAVCDGYIFQGWTENQADDSVLISPYITRRTAEGFYTIIEGHRFYNVTLYASWTPKEYNIDLDDRGATSRGHTEEITMTFDRIGLGVIIPTKTGYTFQGYYTGTRGTGTKYYDASGICVKTWTEEDKKVLYAFWVQDELEVPETGDRTEPTPPPGIELAGNVGCTDAKGLLYADDYNASTGALDDLQPYLTYDTPSSEGAIPGTENLSFRCKMGSWMLSYKLHRNSGTDYVRISVTVPYRTQYERSSDEELVISEQQTATYSFIVPKTWSYWEVMESGMYYPDRVTVTNGALKDGSITVAVERDDSSVEIPDYAVITYGEKENHVFWETVDTDGMPMLTITLTEEQYIISNIPDIEPAVSSYLSVVCGNAAWEDERQAEVRSDKYVFDGVTILSDVLNTNGNGAALQEDTLPDQEARIAITSYLQTYQSGIELDELKPNGTYDTTAVITYVGDENNVGTSATKEMLLNDINKLKIHTPVVCDGVAVDGMEDGVLRLKNAWNFFAFRIDNEGTHRMSLGYGNKNFARSLSGKSNLAMEEGSCLNQIKFPFDVYVDVGNDFLKEDGNSCISAGTWITTGVESQQFYIPITTKNGKYQVEFRSIAVNCPKDDAGQFTMADISQMKANVDWEKYVATDFMELEIRSYLKDFKIISTDDPMAAEELAGGCQALTLKKGYHFSYQLLTQGEFYGDDAEIMVTPKFFWESEDGSERQEIAIYQAEKLLYGEQKECYAWEVEPELMQHENYDVILQCFRESFFLAADVLCTTKDTESFSLEEYTKKQTITGKEEFFIQSGFLIIQFEIKVKSNTGVWYTFDNWMSTELAADALEAGWNYMPGDVVRYDLSKSIADDYEVGGVE